MNTLPNLDEIVLQTLDFFDHNQPPRIDLDTYDFPFVVGSGNAYNTGTILFSGRAAVFADESNFRKMIEAYGPAIEKGLITQAIIISASGEKDSVWEIELAKKHNLSTTLLTCDANSSAAKVADKVFAYRKIAEPYTYNTSTYLGMVLSSTNEATKSIKQFVDTLALPENFSHYSAYSFILPDQYASVCPMLDIKNNELFGPFSLLRAFPEGHARHAKFVIPTEQELVIGVGASTDYFGHPDHRLTIALPDDANFGFVLALTYFITGKIQASKPPYFKDNISNYCLDYGPKAYGKAGTFDIIVPGN
jgi:hypothetical protein